MTPKEFHTLLLLVEAGGQAVEREWMVRTIWPDTVVGDTSLGRNISALRRHLGVDAIKSVAKFGYRLVPEVTAEAAEPVVRAVVDNPVAAERVRASERSESVEFTGQSFTAEELPPAEEPPPPLAAPLPEEGPLATAEEPTGRDSAGREDGRRGGRFGGPWPLRIAVAALLLLLPALLFRLLAHREHTRTHEEEGAARWDDMGLFALREGTYFKASKAFEQALALNPRSVLAHAHLADAALHLQLVETARTEMLMASDRDRIAQLPPAEQRYIDAIRATTLRDFPAATRQFEAILAALPEAVKANGLEDLGRAYQDEGRIADAVRSYEQAAALAPTNAGVFLHLGILEGLQRNQNRANESFDRATALYDASTNLEGAGEVAYQRACMAYVRADYPRAESYLAASLDAANRLGDPQLQTRSWEMLSTVERWDGKLTESAAAAQRGIDISRASGWDFGSAEGVVLLANLALARHDGPESQKLLQEGLLLAEKLKNPRLTANAEFSLASLLGEMGDAQGELALGLRAREHYASYGSVDGAADATLLIVDGKVQLGNFREALADGETLLRASEQNGSELFAEDAEEAIGNVLAATGNHPEALLHYTHALQLGRKLHSEVALKTFDVAACLLKMGRVKEASAAIASLPKAAEDDTDVRHVSGEVRMWMELAEGHDAQAVAMARKAAAMEMTPQAAIDFTEQMVYARLRSGARDVAAREATALLRVATDGRNPYALARAQLAMAAAESPERAKELGRAAAAFFHESGAVEAEWKALLCEAHALELTGDKAGSDAATKAANALMERWQGGWPEADRASYARRPDNRGLIAQAMRL